MSAKVLLSVKPEYAEKIFSGEKQYEFRKHGFGRGVDCVVVYVTYPVGRIIGEFTVGDIIRDSPNGLWTKTQNVAGISKKRFFQYFSGKDYGVAIQIKAIVKYEYEINPYTAWHNFTAPQSFRYL